LMSAPTQPRRLPATSNGRFRYRSGRAPLRHASTSGSMVDLERQPSLPRSFSVVLDSPVPPALGSRIPRQRASPGVTEFKRGALLPKSAPQHEKGTGAGERLRAYFSQKCPLTRLTESGLLKSWQGISRSIEAVLRYSLGVTMLKHSSLCCDRISC